MHEKQLITTLLSTFSTFMAVGLIVQRSFNWKSCCINTKYALIRSRLNFKNSDKFSLLEMAHSGILITWKSNNIQILLEGYILTKRSNIFKVIVHFISPRTNIELYQIVFRIYFIFFSSFLLNG